MGDLSLTYLLLLLLFSICFIPFLIALKKRKFDIFEIIYWASTYFLFIFGFRSLYLFIFGSEFLGQPPFNEDTITAWNISLTYLIISFIFFLIAYYSKIGISIANTLPKLPKEWSVKKAKIFLPIFVIISFVSYAALIKYLGGLSYYLTHKAEILTTGGIIYLSSFISLLAYSFLISSIFTFRYRKFRKLTFLILFPLVLITGFFSGSKREFLFPVLMGVMAFHYFKKPIKIKHIVLLLILAFMIFPIFNIYRYVKSLTRLSEAFVIYSNPLKLVYAFMMRFHGIDSMIYIIRDTPGVMDYQLGKTIAPVFVSWIPRQLWEEKPIIAFGKIFGETYFKKFFGGTGAVPSPTLIGESYINFHVAGILWATFLMGIILKFFYHYLIKNNYGASGVFIYISIFPMLFFMFWESEIASRISTFLFSLFLLFIISLLLSKRTIKANENSNN